MPKNQIKPSEFAIRETPEDLIKKFAKAQPPVEIKCEISHEVNQILWARQKYIKDVSKLEVPLNVVLEELIKLGAENNGDFQKWFVKQKSVDFSAQNGNGNGNGMVRNGGANPGNQANKNNEEKLLET